MVGPDFGHCGLIIEVFRFPGLWWRCYEEVAKYRLSSTGLKVERSCGATNILL
jgi:hypothetical protein